MSRDNDRRRRGVFTLQRARLLVDLLEHGPSSIEALAHRAGAHQNTVREHLGRLHDAGFVVRSVVGSGRPGRPRVAYRLVDATVDGPLVDERQAASAIAVAEAFDRTSTRRGAPDGPWWAAERALVVDHLERHGFEPVEDAVEVVVRCPLTDSWPRVGPAVCAAHVQVLDGVVASVPEDRGAPVPPRIVYRPHTEPGVCRLRLSRPR
ncbi:helix-turn-helix domain-containing protein [Curtobacterium luteum]|uniref:HVO_A0114 family putative DNA-binding protein n=1 Tax=Curtobacterium luteum TaxID=33881 RepID=UPI0038102AE6